MRRRSIPPATALFGALALAVVGAGDDTGADVVHDVLADATEKVGV